MQAQRTATVRFTVPFADIDAMQVVWHGNYFKYFDLARDQLFRDAGIDLYRAVDDDVVFPVTRTQTKHIRPLRFRDEVDCTATLVESEHRLGRRFRDTSRQRHLVHERAHRTGGRAPGREHPTLELRVPEMIRKALDAIPR